MFFNKRQSNPVRSASAVWWQRVPSPSCMLSREMTERPLATSMDLAINVLLNPKPLPIKNACAG